MSHYHHRRIKPVRRWRKSDWSFWEGSTRVVRKCGEKVCWSADEIKAVRVEQEQQSGKALRYYFRPHCGYYHLTSKV
jgi:hypothetical protein